jgi:TM2 domain-containing membrane protein YozV
VSGTGSTSNVIAALASFLVPGLRQLAQGRLGKALLMFVLAGALWFVLLGWLAHLRSAYDAAVWKSEVAEA